MSWYDPSSWGQGADPNQVRDDARNQLNNAAAEAQRFGNVGQSNYQNATGQLQGTYGNLSDAMNYLRGIGQGQNSVAMQQLGQGLQQNVAAQRSMAASAAPQNSAMAARIAAQNAAKLGYGLSGQAAVAGLQERNQAMQNYGQLGQALGQLQLGQRGQDVNVALGSRQNALTGYGGILNGAQDQGFLQRNGQALQGFGSALGTLNLGGGGGGINPNDSSQYWQGSQRTGSLYGL